MPDSPPFAARLLDWIVNPILVKELRATFRARRFFFTHLSAISILAVVFLLVAWFSMRGGTGARSAEVGFNLFTAFVICEVLLTFLVFPAFGCTSIVIERQQKSIDLLLTTTLKPWEIVWGKFSAAMSYGWVFLASALPLVAVCFLFGGVSVLDLVLACVAVLVLAAVVNIFSIFVSATAQNAQRAVSGGYAVLLVIGLCASAALFPLLLARGFGPMGLLTLSYASLAPENQALVVGLALFLLLAWFVGFFLLATNRLKPTAGNRSTGLRIYCVCALGGGTALAVEACGLNWSILDADWRWAVTAGLAAAVSLAGWGVGFFSCEDLQPALRIRRFLARLPLPARALGLFLPGAGSGAVFSLLLGAAVYYGLHAGLASECLPDGITPAPVNALRLVTLADWGPPFLAFLAFVNATGLLLSALWSSEWTRRLILALLVLLVMFVPLILTMVDAADLHGNAPPPARLGNLYFVSPLLVFGSVWMEHQESPGVLKPFPLRMHCGAEEVRVADVFTRTYAAVAGVLFLLAFVLGRRRARRLALAAGGT